MRHSVCLLALLLLMTLQGRAQTAAEKPHYVGSEKCKSCHADLYAGWKQTRMANVVRDPKEHPEAVLGDFAHPDPLRAVGRRKKEVAAIPRGEGNRLVGSLLR
jgi:hypothetical protein